jgi:hypothetical protein
MTHRTLSLLRSLLAAGVLTLVPPAHAETTAQAIDRIRSGSHSPMPAPEQAHTAGPVGKGMTIENGTGHLLRLHFGGPVARSVDVPDGDAVGVDLAVGAYDVAAEVPGERIVPFFGHQAYEPGTHYWLKFFVR